MSFVIRQITLIDFRKFRSPLTIDGLSTGLNIIIEPNETGKSTLLEALRAAFFVRHNTRNQLASSYAPFGEAVAPQIRVAFEANGDPWSVSKRFLRSPAVEVDGPGGRAQGEEAEARLHDLLGSVRDASQRGDPATYGALGLLWVAQAEALAVSAPGQIVRDTVRATLEMEVGAIMGGPAYRRVRERVEAKYLSYWTPTGQRRGLQTQAQERLDSAASAAREAVDRLASLERSFGELETARTRLRLVRREIADDADVETRKELVLAQEVARSAAQILATRQAERTAADEKVKALDDLWNRHELAVTAVTDAERAFDQAQAKNAAYASELGAANAKREDARSVLDAARTERQQALGALTAGEAQLQEAERSRAHAAARQRLAVVIDLEEQRRGAHALSETLIAPATLATLEADERAVAEARATLNAGGTRIALTGDPEGVMIDGRPMLPGEFTLTKESVISLGGAALRIRPPASVTSVEAKLDDLLSRQRTHLEELGLYDLAAARSRNEAARDAAADVRTLDARIAAATPADEAIGLAAGPEALKLMFANAEDVAADAPSDAPDLNGLKSALDAADSRLARATGALESATEVLRREEAASLPRAAAAAGAESGLANARAQLAVIENRPDFVMLADTLQTSRETAATAGVRLDAAERDAAAHDATSISRRLEAIDARTRSALEVRAKLEAEIARLEGVVESEGGKGLAEREAAAREELEAARAASERVSQEADTLKLLRGTLDQAQADVSGRFVGPVAKRAKRYIERLLPGCDLTFSEDLGLEAVTRGGMSEGCQNLSRGTQEQLAVLTRLAFADMLLDQGRPISLILDDPLVYSDDARLDLMTDILLSAAERMQVILLTCRERAFRHLPATRIALPR